MKKTFSAIGLLCYIMAMLLGVSGCMGESKAERIADEMLDYMSAKYGEDFVAISLHTKGVEMGYDELVCYEANSSPLTDKVYVRRYTTDDGIEFHDSYWGILIRSQLEKEINDVCLSYFTTSVTYASMSVHTFNDELKEDSSLEDGLAMGESIHATVFIYVESKENNNVDEYARTVLEIIKRKFPHNVMRLFYVTDGTCEKINRNNYNSFLNDYYNPDGKTCLAIY